MSKLGVTALALLLASSVYAQAEYVSLNGVWWLRASAAERTLWLEGYNDGFTDALKLAASIKSETNKERPAPQTASERIHLRNLMRYTAADPQIVPNHALLDEMALFYKDFRNTPVCWSDAEPVAELALTVGAPSEIELDALRAEDAKSGCGKFPTQDASTSR